MPIIGLTIPGQKIAGEMSGTDDAARPWVERQTREINTSTAVRAVIIAYIDARGPIPNGGHQSSRLAPIVQPDRFRTTDVRASALNA
jgi:hypothetical protein